MRKKIIPIILVLFTVLYISCKKEHYVSGSSLNLKFSSDTVMFDTLFTKFGSVTHYLKVYNKSSGTALLDRIKLARSGNTPYRIMVDGIQSDAVNNIEIPEGDSIYIMVESTLPENLSKEPFIVKDSILFESGGYSQDVDIISWGQNVTLINNEVLTTEILDGDLPYLFYGNVVVDTTKQLQIPEGTRIYFHKNARLTVYGTIDIDGTVDKPVIFSGDRLEKFYKTKPGLWGGLFIEDVSSGADISNLKLYNSENGIHINKLKSGVKVILNNTEVKFTLKNGLDVLGSEVESYNCLFSDSYENAVYLRGGGKYKFVHSTVGFSRYAAFRIGANVDESGYSDISIDARNNIIYGSGINQMTVSAIATIGNVQFKNNFIKVTNKTNFKDSWFTNTSFSIDKTKYDVNKLFYNAKDGFYYLGKETPFKDAGDLNTGSNIPLDLLGRSRMADGLPDLGAYEYFNTDKE
jgi:hypothetical protein